MWYEILPAAAIIYGAFSVATMGMYVMHKVFLGNVYRRDLTLPYNRRLYLRDRRLMNDPYLFNGLETIKPRTCDETDPPCCCPPKKGRKSKK